MSVFLPQFRVGHFEQTQEGWQAQSFGNRVLFSLEPDSTDGRKSRTGLCLQSGVWGRHQKFAICLFVDPLSVCLSSGDLTSNPSRQWLESSPHPYDRWNKNNESCSFCLSMFICVLTQTHCTCDISMFTKVDFILFPCCRPIHGILVM